MPDHAEDAPRYTEEAMRRRVATRYQGQDPRTNAPRDARALLAKWDREKGRVDSLREQLRETRAELRHLREIKDRLGLRDGDVLDVVAEHSEGQIAYLLVKRARPITTLEDAVMLLGPRPQPTTTATPPAGTPTPTAITPDTDTEGYHPSRASNTPESREDPSSGQKVSEVVTTDGDTDGDGVDCDGDGDGDGDGRGIVTRTVYGRYSHGLGRFRCCVPVFGGLGQHLRPAATDNDGDGLEAQDEHPTAPVEEVVQAEEELSCPAGPPTDDELEFIVTIHDRMGLKYSSAKTYASRLSALRTRGWPKPEKPLDVSAVKALGRFRALSRFKGLW